MSEDRTSADIDQLENFVQTGSAQRAPFVEDIEGLRSFRQRVYDACGDRRVDSDAVPNFDDLLTMMHDNEMYVQEIATTLREGDYETIEMADGSVIVTGDISSTVDPRFLGDGDGVIEVDAAQLVGLPPTSGFADDPVCVANGNFIHGDHDLGFPGITSALDVVRYYNSCVAAGMPNAREVGVFGRGWSSLLDITLDHTPNAGTGMVRVQLGDGGVVPFVRRADGSWRRSGRRRQLHLTETAGCEHAWELGDGAGHTWRFDEEGRLASGLFAGAQVEVDRRAGGRIVVRELTSGRSVTYRFNEHGLVERATSSDGREVTYRYDEQANCVAAERALGAVRYEIVDDLITAIHDADEVLVCRNTYDAAGRVLTQLSPFGRLTRYDYSDFARGVVRVIDDTDGCVNRYVHDRRGNLTAVTDAAEGTMTLAYDNHDRLVKVTDRTGAITTYRYQVDPDPSTPATDRLLVRVDADGGAHRWDYDEQGRLTAETDRAGGVHRYEYPDAVTLDCSAVTGPEGASVSVTRDGRGLPIEISDGDGVITRHVYDSDGQLAATVNGAGERTVFVHDRAGRMIKVTGPAGSSATFEHDEQGRLAVVRTAEGLTERYRYSTAGRVLDCEIDGPGSWSATYGPHGKASTFTDATGATVAFGYSQEGYLETVTSPDGATYRYEYSPTGQIVAAVDAASGRTEQSFDAEDRPLQLSLPGGETWSRELDPLGRTASITGPGGAVTTWSYHPNGEIATSRNPVGEVCATEVDLLGNVTAELAADGSRTSYTYTPGERLAAVTTPAGRTWRYSYDAGGRLSAAIDPDGRTTRLTHRPDGQLDSMTTDGVEGAGPRVDGATSRSTSDGSTAIELWYDHAGRPTSHVSRSGGAAGADEAIHHGPVTSWAGNGLAASNTAPGDRRAAFDWDPRGLLTGITDPAAIVTQVTRDARGRTTGITTADQARALSYDLAGNVASSIDPLGRTTHYTYSPSGRLEAFANGGDGIGARFTYDAGGNVAGVHDLAGASLLALTHDSAGRLQSSTNGLGTWNLKFDSLGLIGGIASPLGAVSIERDADGVVIGQSDPLGAVSYERSPGGRLDGFRLDDGSSVTVPEPARPLDTDRGGRITTDSHGRSFGYDTAGRLASATGPDGFSYQATYNDYGLLATDVSTTSRRVYRYDQATQLTETIEDGESITYSYDGAGRRCREQRPDGSTVIYRWNDLDHLTEIAVTGPDGATSSRSIGYGPLGRPELIDGETVITWDDGITGKPVGIGDTRYLRHGTQTLRIGSDGAADGEWDDNTTDDPWGHEPDVAGVRIGYRGELAVDEWLFMGDRVYHPATRSFLTTDPLPPVPGQNAFASPYVYAWCDPINYLDPTGRQPIGLEAYEEIRSREEGSRFGRAIDAFKEDPWGSLAVAGLVVAGGVMMFTPLAPVGAGILIGVGTSTAMGIATDNVNPRAIAVSGAIGGASGGAGALASNAGAGLGTTLVIGATSGGAESVGVQIFAEGTSFTDINWTRVAFDTTIGGVGSGAGHTIQTRAGAGSGTPSPTIEVDGTRYIYGERVIDRAVEEPGPYHNFPQVFDTDILRAGSRNVIDDGYIEYSIPGRVNGTNGVFEIGTRPTALGDGELITHRFFDPSQQ